MKRGERWKRVAETWLKQFFSCNRNSEKPLVSYSGLDFRTLIEKKINKTARAHRMTSESFWMSKHYLDAEEA